MSIPNFSNFFLKRLRVGAPQDPVRDWIMALIFSAIVLAGVIVWNAWAFGTVARGGVIGSVEPSSLPVFKSSSLDAIHGIFANRVTEESKYETGAYRYVDPSQ